MKGRNAVSSRIRDHIRSNVVGYVAVFLAMGGSAYAVNGPAPGINSVGTADIITKEVKRSDVALDAINSSRVAADSLTGADVAESSLGQVPSANTANSATTATTATNATNAGNAGTLDSIDSTGFLQTGATAGGDLSGTFSNLQIGVGAVGGAEVTDNSLGPADLADVSALKGRLITCDDPTVNGQSFTCTDLNLVGTGTGAGTVRLTVQCQDEAGGGVTARVVFSDSMGNDWAFTSSGSNADPPEALLTSAQRTLVRTGPTTSPAYAAGAYSAIDSASGASYNGEAGAGTNIFGKDCAFGLSALGG